MMEVRNPDLGLLFLKRLSEPLFSIVDIQELGWGHA